MISTQTLLRFTTLTLIGLTLLVYAGPIKDFKSEDVAHILGWINNISMAWIFVYLALLPLVLLKLSTARERVIAACLIAMCGITTAWTIHTAQDALVQIGGILALSGATAAGLLSYLLTRDGTDFPHRIVLAVVLATPALPIAPALIALFPDAYDNFMLKVYGFSNVRVIGYFCCGLTGLLTAIALHRTTSTALQVALAVGLAITWAVMFWSGSRGAFLATVIGLAIAIAILGRVSMKGSALAAAGTAAGVGISAFLHVPGPQFGIIARVSDNLETVRTTAASGASAEEVARAVSSNRSELWMWSMDRIMEAPLTGHGYLPMSWMREEPFNYYHTHNIVLEYFISFGLIGGSLILFAGFWAWLRAAMAARAIDHPVSSGLFAFVTVLPIHACLSAALFFPYHLMLFMMALGALIGWDVAIRRSTESVDGDEVEFRAKADWMLDDA